MTVRILTGDCRDVLAGLPDASVQCCVTSPPYFGLRDYGTASWDGGDAECDHKAIQERGSRERKRSTLATTTFGNIAAADSAAAVYRTECGKCGARRVDQQIGLESSVEEYVAQLVVVFREVRRVLRDDGVLFLNLGDSYASSGISGIQSATANLSRHGGKGHNPKMTEQVFGRAPTPNGLKPKDLIGIPWRVAFALQADGWYLRSDIIWAKPNPMPESVRDRPTKAHEYIFLMSKSPRYFWDAEAVKEDSEMKPQNRYTNGRGDKDVGYAAHRKAPGMTEPNGRNIRSVWTIATAPFSEAHFATFPPALAERCIKAGTSEKGACGACGAPWVRVVEQTGAINGRERTDVGDFFSEKGGNPSGMRSLSGATYQPQRRATDQWNPTCTCDASTVPCMVLDPFGGAGTVSLVAERLGRDSIYIELSSEYAEMARKRITGDCPMFASIV